MNIAKYFKCKIINCLHSRVAKISAIDFSLWQKLNSSTIQWLKHKKCWIYLIFIYIFFLRRFSFIHLKLTWQKETMRILFVFKHSVQTWKIQKFKTTFLKISLGNLEILFWRCYILILILRWLKANWTNVQFYLSRSVVSADLPDKCRNS